MATSRIGTPRATWEMFAMSQLEKCRLKIMKHGERGVGLVAGEEGEERGMGGDLGREIHS